jgi:hypothetical protein
MTTSISYTTPEASFSLTNSAINGPQDDENLSITSSNQGLYHSFAATIPKRQRNTSSIRFPTITTDNTNIQYSDYDYRNEEDEHVRSLRYDSNRVKQERLLLFANIFRLLVIFVLAPTLYFIV